MGRLLNLCAFLGAFAAMTCAVDASFPSGGDLSRGAVKLERYRATASELDVVFLGSSRTFRGFDPALFDAECQRLGRSTASFNLGVHGAFGLDLVHYLEQLARHHARTGEGPDWVLIDPEGVLDERDTQNLLTPSVSAWHDLATTRFAADYVRSLELPPERERELLRGHWSSWLWRRFNIARGAPLAARELGVHLRDPSRFLGPANDGYLPLDLGGPQALASNARLRARPERLYNLARALTRQQRQPQRGQPDAFALELYERILAGCEDLGATPVFVLQPGTHYESDLVKAHARGLVPHLLRFDRVAQYPEFFDLDHRWDYSHLSRAGAEHFTRLLAAEFTALAARP